MATVITKRVPCPNCEAGYHEGSHRAHDDKPASEYIAELKARNKVKRCTGNLKHELGRGAA